MLVAMLGLSGCGHDSSSTATVEGQVTLDGQPLTSGVVITSTDAGRGARGEIDSQGRFALNSGKLGEGALAGIHKVAVKAYASTDLSNPEAPATPLVPRRYMSPASSGLTIEVELGEVNHVELKLVTTQTPVL